MLVYLNITSTPRHNKKNFPPPLYTYIILLGNALSIFIKNKNDITIYTYYTCRCI